MLARLFAIALIVAAPLAAAAAPPPPESLPDDVQRWVAGELTLAQPDLTTVALTGELYLYRYDVNDRVYDADDIGAAYHGVNKYEGEASGAEFVANIEESAENSLRSILASSFLGAEIRDVAADVDEATLREAEGNPLDPPVVIAVSAMVLRDRATLGIGDYTDAQVEAVFASGAELVSDFTLAALTGYTITYHVQAPASPALTITDATTGALSADGKTLTLEVPEGVGEVTSALTLRGVGAPTFTAEQAQIGVLVDIADVDASVGKALGGDLGTLVVDITVEGRLNVIAIPADVKAALPENIRIEHLASDAIRLLLQRELLTEQDIADLESELSSQVSEKLGSALGGTVAVESGFDAASLAASLISTPVSSGDPIVFTATANVLKPLAGGALQSQAAIALYTQELPLALPKIQGLDTEYTVIAPRGLAFTSVTGSGADIEQSTSEDGRDMFVVRPTSESAEITAAVAVTPAFVMTKFWPVVLVAALVLVLIVGTPVALVVMKRRKGKAGAAAPKK